MKTQLKKSIYYFFRIFGYYPPKPLNTPESLSQRLQRQPPLIQEYEIKRECQYLRKINNQKDYNSLLGYLVPDWDKTKIQKARFIGTGKSRGNINTYRKIFVEETPFFEKVFLKSRTDIVGLTTYKNILYPGLTKEITIPKIYQIKEGEALYIVNYQYLDLVKLAPGEEERSIVEISRVLYQWTNHATIPLEIKKNKDYRTHWGFIPFLKEAQSNLLNTSEEIESIDSLINNSPVVLTHGDLHRGNVYQNKTVTDWDDWGFFPIGLEPAIIYFYLVAGKHITKVEGYKDWVSRNYRSFIEERDWAVFERNFLYFLYLISFRSKKMDYFERFNTRLKADFLKEISKNH